MTETRTAADALADWAEKTPDRVFLTQPLDGEIREWTFRQAHEDATRFATALRNLGLSDGDKVAILSKNCAEWLIADVAISMAGMISVPIYPTAGQDMIAHAVSHLHADLLVRLEVDHVVDDELNVAIASDITVAVTDTPDVGTQWVGGGRRRATALR